MDTIRTDEHILKSKIIYHFLGIFSSEFKDLKAWIWHFRPLIHPDTPEFWNAKSSLIGRTSLLGLILHGQFIASYVKLGFQTGPSSCWENGGTKWRLVSQDVSKE
jgi:hypothetical protein